MVTKGVAGQTAVVWIIRNQFGRRNLSNYTRVELVLKLEPLLRVKAKEKQREHGGTAPGKTLKQKSAEVNTRAELAKAAGVSHDTIAKGKVIQAKASEETKARFLPPGVPVAAFEWAGWCPDMGVFWT